MRRASRLLLGCGVGALVLRHALRRKRVDDLRDEVVFITGGSRGFGLALAEAFAAEGCRLALCARDERELADARAALADQCADVFTTVCDVSDRQQVERAVSEATARFGVIDILINNAGMITVGPFDTMTLVDYEQAMAIMFWGVVYPTLAVLPSMQARRHGRIVTITSIGGKVSVPHLLPYACAKFAAVGFSEGLRAELSGRGVTATTIVPGLMRTGSFLNAVFKGKQDLEALWFSLGASLPGVSISAVRAAQAVVRSVKTGEAERILGVPANILARLHGLFPGMMTDVLGGVSRSMLPDPGLADARAGADTGILRTPLVRTATALGRMAARRWQSPASAAGAAARYT